MERNELSGAVAPTDPTREIAIQTDGLRKSYGTVTAVEGLTLTVYRGELFALLGVNGAGKTTTIRMLTGLAVPTAGTARGAGYDLKTELQAVKTVSGISPQETAVSEGLTVRENLVTMARIFGKNAEEAARCADTLIRDFSLEEVASRRAKLLSGGYQQRLSIAMALVGDPKVLYLDEPTLGLDVLARRQLWKLVEGLKGRMTVILTTHYLEEAEALSDRVAVMARGRLLAVDTAEGLKAATGCASFQDAFIKLVGEEAEA